MNSKWSSDEHWQKKKRVRSDRNESERESSVRLKKTEWGGGGGGDGGVKQERVSTGMGMEKG